jgi:hypothetical protein
MSEPGPIDSVQRRVAERRLLDALRRLHRREPLRPDVRLDALLAAARAAPAARSRRHRGATPLLLDDAALGTVVDGLAASGRVVRRGRRVRLPDHRPGLEPAMRERAERLLAGLREAGIDPPRAEAIAARLGLPAAVVAQLRASGELVALAPGIDLPRATWDELRERLDRLAERGPLTVARVRDELRASRRLAEAALARRRADRSERHRSRPDVRRRPPPGGSAPPRPAAGRRR